MSDTNPEDRLRAAISETQTEALLADADSLMNYAEEHMAALDGEERVIQGIFHAQDVAHLRMRQAAVEQQRIANLLALSMNREAGGQTRANALREAINALGVNR